MSIARLFSAYNIEISINANTESNTVEIVVKAHKDNYGVSLFKKIKLTDKNQVDQLVEQSINNMITKILELFNIKTN
ncbi:MAG: hypothetical protein QXI58_01065 [Candidatus Micrarchaeia archaeon]|jgi:hypothetical protein